MHRGIELHDLVELKIHNIVKLLKSRQRRRYSREIQKSGMKKSIKDF